LKLGAEIKAQVLLQVNGLRLEKNSSGTYELTAKVKEIWLAAKAAAVVLIVVLVLVVLVVVAVNLIS
jgi:hypothetical protein